MCLYVPKRIKTEEDIVCYKFLIKFTNPDGSVLYTSPFFTSTTWKPGEEKIEHPDVDRKLHTWRSELNEGFFYAYKSLKEAVWEGASSYNYNFNPSLKRTVTVGKFIIPKDASHIYEGTQDDLASIREAEPDRPIYATSKIRFVGEFPVEEVVKELDAFIDYCVSMDFPRTRKEVEQWKASLLEKRP